MLINRSLDRYQRLQLLGGMAGDDILGSRPEPTFVATPQRRSPSPNRAMPPGVYRAAMPNGRFISLLRVMFTDVCKYDCAYCPNSVYVPRKRYAFTVDELAKLFMEMHQRHTVDGLFLSSGIPSTPSKIEEKLVQVVEALRTKYRFTGYIHLKVMPGTERQYVEAAHRLGTRLSINLEAPSAERLARVSTMKDFERHMLEPMRWIHNLTRERYGEGGAVGQVTQLVVGASDESDEEIFQRVSQLYDELDLKRVYYSAFRPASFTPLEEHPLTPMWREHRLYQLDWLKRVYHLTPDELRHAFDRNGFLDKELDPKTAIALEHLDAFPVDLNAADREQLLRVPGIGPKATERILQERRRQAIRSWRDLQAMGVVRRWALPFVVFPGHRPTPARQGKLSLFSEQSAPQPKPLPMAQPEPPASLGCCASPACGSCPIAGLAGAATAMA